MNKINKILYTAEEIDKAVFLLSQQINDYYKNEKNVIVMPVLDGAIVFTGRILTKFNFDLNLETIKINSYYNNKFSNKKPNFKFSFAKKNIKNKKILILEDLIDQGHTITLLKNKLLKIGAKEVKICVLFKKIIPQYLISKQRIEPDWYGLILPNEWVAGYGIDSQKKLRNLDFIASIKN